MLGKAPGAEPGLGWAPRYLPHLDGLRAVAVGLVVGYHVLYGLRGPAPGAFIGVDLFFVLSGFLITSLLLAERLRSGRVSLSGFYRRRFWRLYPGLVLVCLVVVAVAPLLDTKDGVLRGVVYALLYVASWAFAMDLPQGVLGHAWSLSVEEHFYVVWPLVLLGVLRWAGPRRLLAWTVGLTVTAALWPVLLVILGDPSRDRLYAGPDARGVGLLVGCCLAVLLHEPRGLGWVRKVVTLPGLLGATIAALGAVVLLVHRTSLGYLLVGQALIAVAGAIVIAHLVLVEGRLARLLAFSPYVLIGRWSYGIYLWHLPMMAITAVVAETRESRVAGALLSIGVAALSFRYVEQPLLRRFGHTAASQPAVRAVPAPVTESVS